MLYAKKGDSVSVGQVLLSPKRLLERRVLSDDRIEIYDCGRDDAGTSGQVDRRVLATLEYLAESGMRPTVTSLKCGHGFYKKSGNVSEHSSGNAVDMRRSTAYRSSATRRSAGSPSRPCAALCVSRARCSRTR